MREDDTIRLRHMLDAARQAIHFAQSKTRSDLDGDLMLTLSLMKLLEIVGEAASQVTEFGQGEVPDVPWADIIGMRHRLVHAYFDINLDILWQTVQHDVPPLIAALETVVPSEEE